LGVEGGVAAATGEKDFNHATDGQTTQYYIGHALGNLCPSVLFAGE
jgi:hypothetical protein